MVSGVWCTMVSGAKLPFLNQTESKVMVCDLLTEFGSFATLAKAAFIATEAMATDAKVGTIEVRQISGF